ncbi:MAG TPA: C4-type zinc ribbon domain-containing protein [Dehalococcoidia bacterium]|nr:C4-type zinc ribbon domain-containing protein [Dehalococcoidia bacterium]
MTTVAELFALQETDLAIDSLRQRLEDVVGRLQEPADLLELREEVARMRRGLLDLRHRQREAEWEVEDLRRKAKAVEDKLYGGSVRNPKELQDLQADLESLQRQLSRREDALLELMLQGDEQEAALRDREALLARREEEWRAEEAALRSQKEALEGELAALEERRAGQAVRINGAALRLYQELRSRRQGRAVARVERGLCGGCRITLPTSLIQQARSGNALVQCVSCERILYVG